MKTLMLLLIAMGALALGLGPQAMAAEEEQAATITISGQTYTVVPDEEVRELGFEVPDVKPEDNAAYDYLKAIEAYRPIERGDALERLQEEAMRTGWTEETAPLADYLERNEEALELIRAGASKDVCHFPLLVTFGSTLEEASPAGIVLPHLSKMREFARFLVVVGKAYEFEGRDAEALDAYLLAFQMGNHVAQNPTLIAGLVGIACSAVGMPAIEQCLVRHEIDAEVLARAQQRVHELSKQRPSVATAMRSERAFCTSIIEYTIKHPAHAAGLGQDSALGQTAMALMFRSEEGRAQIRRDVREFWDATDKALELPLPVFISSGAGDELIRKAKERKFPPNVMALMGPVTSRARISYARNELSWTVLDVEFALARYAAEHDRYPESLDELKDLMLSDGLDPYSGEPLKYRLEADGAYTIWSVGENLVDDGGAVGTHSPDWRADDFVWNSAVIYGG